MRWAVLALTLVMAVAGVILLALAEPTLAQAQTPGNSPRSLVNNFHPSTDFAILSTNILYGQGFTTGPDSYSLDGVSLGLVNIEAGGELAVSIHSKGGDGFPTFPALYTLTAPDPLEGSAKNHFLALAGAVLEASTDYVVVMDSPGNSPRAQGFVTGPDFYNLRNIGLIPPAKRGQRRIPCGGDPSPIMDCFGGAQGIGRRPVTRTKNHSWDADYPADTALYQLTPSRHSQPGGWP